MRKEIPFYPIALPLGVKIQLSAFPQTILVRPRTGECQESNSHYSKPSYLNEAFAGASYLLILLTVRAGIGRLCRVLSEMFTNVESSERETLRYGRAFFAVGIFSALKC
jgi:hypothetical protein